MSKFQIILIAVILGMVALAGLVLSGVLPGLPGHQSKPAANLTIWGTFSSEEMTPIINLINEQNQKRFLLKYIQKDPLTYHSDLVDALAAGEGPDLWFTSQDWILKDKDKLYQIPFTVLSERDFRDAFIDEASLFLSQKGFYAVPVAVDPIVLYWNKDLFRAAGIVSPPQNWDEFLNYSQALTKKDASGNIVQSGAAMGVASNVSYFKDIISLLLFQSGNQIVISGNKPGSWKVVFGASSSSAADATASALKFFTAFSNPLLVSYSWNRALLSSKEFFIANKLAMYLGRASEIEEIKKANPHLNFDVALVPQLSGSSSSFTFGQLYGLAVSKSSANISSAISAAFAFTGQEELDLMKIPPARRAMLKTKPSDPIDAVFYKAAVQSAGWLEPDPKAVSKIFSDMIESIITGRKKISTAIRDAKTLLGEEMEKTTK